MFKKVAVALVIFTLSACSQKADVVTSDGQTINLSKLQGKWLVVNYWAKWCKNCRTDLRDFDRFHNAYRDQVIVLGVNFDGIDNQQLNHLKDKWQITFPQAGHFPIERFGVKEIETLPRTYVFSPDGKLHKTLNGPQTVRMLASAIDITQSKNISSAGKK